MSDDSFSVQKDWRLNATEQVKDQGSCGSCWAVATINMLEAHYEIKHPAHPVKFAIQDLVDCVDNPKHCGGTGGCEGGTVELAMEYIQGNNLNTAVGNGYLGKDTNKNACNPQSGGFSAAQLGLVRYRTLPSNKAEPVMLALQSGPVAVALEANNKWFHYKTGIVDGCNQKDTTINHAVLLRGYGKDEAGKNYWKILNSWGKRWGDDGSILITKQSTLQQEEEHCAVDNKPLDGVGCIGGEPRVTVCGTCGVLYDVVALEM